MVKFEYLQPQTITEALELLERHGDEAKVMAGGTALLLWMKQGLIQPRYVVNISKIEELKTIASDERSGLRIGAIALHRQVEMNPAIREKYPLLAATMHEVASVRIRNMGTMGGSLCHADPMLDPALALLALDASVTLVSRKGKRSLPLEEFFVDYYETVLEPAELLTEVQVPPSPPDLAWGRIKFTPRSVQDFATVGVAIALRLDPQNHRCRDVRIVLNAVAPVVMRAKGAEGVLRGQELSDALIREAAQVASTEVDPTDDLRGSAAYKREMVKVWVRRVLHRALERAAG